MRVLFLTKSASAFGGVEQWLADLAYGLMKRGFQCLVGAADGARFHSAAAYAAQNPGLPVAALDGRSGSPAGRRLAVAKVIRDFRPDIVMPVMLFDGLLAATALKRRYCFRIVYPIHEHNGGAFHDVELFGPAIDRVVAVDRLTQDTVARVQNTACCSLIPCGVPIAGCEVNRKAGKSVFRIGYCGRLEAEIKRVQDLVGIWQELGGIENLELWIAGDGTQRDRLLVELKAVRQGNGIRYLGVLSRQELYREFYPELHALVITSSSETGPLVAFEAMMHGVAIVASRFEGLESEGIFRDSYNCLLFDIGDAEASARAISRLKESTELRDRIVSNAISCVRTARTISGMCDEWARLIEDTSDRATIYSDVSWRDVLPVKEQLKEYLRRASGRRFIHSSVRSEWPFYSS